MIKTIEISLFGNSLYRPSNIMKQLQDMYVVEVTKALFNVMHFHLFIVRTCTTNICQHRWWFQVHTIAFRRSVHSTCTAKRMISSAKRRSGVNKLLCSSTSQPTFCQETTSSKGWRSHWVFKLSSSMQYKTKDGVLKNVTIQSQKLWTKKFLV